MVAKTLVEENIVGGRKLIEALDRVLDIPAALWLYLPESDIWRLVLATSRVDKEGPRAVYAQIDEILSSLPDENLPTLEDISVVSPSDKLIQTVGSEIRTGRKLARIRLTGNSIDNTYVDDALIYRMDVH